MSEWVALSTIIERDRMDDVTRLLQEHGATGFEEAPPDGMVPDLVQPWEKRRATVHPRLTLRTWLNPEDASRAAHAFNEAFPEL